MPRRFQFSQSDVEERTSGQGVGTSRASSFNASQSQRFGSQMLTLRWPHVKASVRLRCKSHTGV